MPEFVIQHDYSNGADLAFKAGQTVDLDDATAACLETDSPGVLGTSVPEPADEEPEPVEAAEDLDEQDEAPVQDEAPKAKRTRAKA